MLKNNKNAIVYIKIIGLINALTLIFTLTLLGEHFYTDRTVDITVLNDYQPLFVVLFLLNGSLYLFIKKRQDTLD